jgi:outer membrane protein assembly factor BamA
VEPDGASGVSGPYDLRYQSVTTIAASVSIDTRDRIVAPTRGGALFWRSEIADRTIGSGASFARNTLDAQGALPIISGVSLLGSAHFGSAFGDDLPLHDWFYLGGSVSSDVWSSQFVPFLGIDPQSQAGRSVQVLGAGVQAEVPFDLLVALMGNVGNVFDTWPSGVRGNGYQSGVGITASRHFAPGPLSITVATRSWSQKPIVELVFGASF